MCGRSWLRYLMLFSSLEHFYTWAKRISVGKPWISCSDSGASLHGWLWPNTCCTTQSSLTQCALSRLRARSLWREPSVSSRSSLVQHSLDCACLATLTDSLVSIFLYSLCTPWWTETWYGTLTMIYLTIHWYLPVCTSILSCSSPFRKYSRLFEFHHSVI